MTAIADKTVADPQQIIAEFERKLDELTAQQAATVDILKVIASSPGDLQPVFEVIADRAMRLLDCWSVIVTRFDGECFQFGAARGALPDTEQFARQRYQSMRPGRASLLGRSLLERTVVSSADAQAEPDPQLRDYARKRGLRAVLVVPLLRDDKVEGALVLTRAEPGLFAPREIELVQTFADQAVIAIQNARMFDEVNARTRDLGESLQQQTATADVLKVISRSVFDLQTVLDTLVESAYKLCGANLGLLYLRGEEAFECKAIAGAGVTEASVLFKGRPIRAGRGTAAERVILTGEVQSITNFFEDPEMDPKIREAIRNANGPDSTIGQIRSTLAVPMTRDNAVIGVMVIGCSQTGPFPQRQIELLQTFADQAVIAIENVRLFDEVQAKTRDLGESLQQQTATADVLKVISRSAFDLKSVLTTLTESAKSLCGASLGIICLRDGEVMRLQAESGCTQAFVDFMQANPIRPGRATITGRVFMDNKPVHVADVQHDPEYNFGQAPTIGAYRAVLAVPLMRDGAVEGVLLLGRPKPGPFSQRQIDLVQTFADQAVIAIENARLFNETKEALERQTATAGILKVIASSPSDVQPVFEAIVRSANTLIGGFSSTVFRFIDGVGHLKAFTPTTPAADEVLRATFPLPVSDFQPFQMAQAGEATQIADTETLTNEILNIARARGFRSILFAPMMSDGVSIGSIAVTRVQPGAFADHHVQLLQTFADQAVIAIENVRLFEQVQAKTRDLTELLEQQTAAAEVLKVISSSAFDLQAVFETVVESSARLAGADRTRAFIYRFDGELLRLAAAFNAPKELKDFVEQNPVRPGRHSGAARAALERRTTHIPDVLADPEYTFGAKETLRTLLAVPILKGDDLLGVLLLYLLEVEPFTDRHIAQVETFADQAAIAIENVRLFEAEQQRTREVTESLQQQTATADVLKVISRSTFDLQSVLDTLIGSAVKLCGALNGTICLREGDGYRHRASSGIHGDWAKFLNEHPPTPGRGSMTGRVLLSGRPESIPDVLEDPDYVFPLADMNKTRSVFGVPLLRHDEVEGVLLLARAEPGLLTQRQIELVQTFADQAVIAIENARLLTELRQRTDDLTESLEHLRTAQDRLVQTEKLASLGQLTAGIAHEIKNPLNFVNNFSALSAELIDELNDALKPPVALDDKVREEIDELTQMLKGNLEKVVQHGKRADSIVKNMLLHSREGAGEHRPADINAIVEESLNLAYHGARAEKPGFNITLQRDLDPAAGMIDLYPQEMTRVFLNLISNGFYAAAKRKEAGDEGFEPTLSATTKSLGNKVEIRIRDNGTGIPPDVKERIFNPFFTTKPAGEGTGLGLSMSHDIVVKQHGGKIEVDTMPGAFTEFIITLPRAAAAQQQAGGTN
jgi:two-component system, NtrC family, sensor kinase